MTTEVVQFGDARLPDRFWSKCVPEPNSGCWLWFACRNQKGYGSFGIRSYQTELAHRYAYRSLVADIETGKEIDHKCRVRCCVNPAHLEPVLHRVNVLRGAVKKTHCKRGHELAGHNLMPTANGTRCRSCSTEDSTRRYREGRRR